MNKRHIEITLAEVHLSAGRVKGRPKGSTKLTTGSIMLSQGFSIELRESSWPMRREFIYLLTIRSDETEALVRHTQQRNSVRRKTMNME